MDYKNLIDELLIKGKEKMDDLEIYIVSNKAIEIGIFGGEVDKYSISETGGLSLRGVSNGKMGYSYTEKIDQTSINMLIDEAYENGKYIDDLDGDEIFSGSINYEELNKYDDRLSNTPMIDKIEFTKNIEKEALAIDPRVIAVQVCGYEEFEQERFIVNTKGVNLYDRLNGAVGYISVVVKDGDDTKTGLGFRIFSDLADVDYKIIAEEAVNEAISMIGATPIKTGNYPMIIKNTIFADLIQAFVSVFSGDNAQKGLSLLKDKIGDTIASPIFTLVDDPFYKEGYASKAFDDEGTSTGYKKVIEKGVLNTLLHSWKTAKKEGIQSTGNGSRSSYKSTLSISPTNFYVEKGDTTFDELIKNIDKGIYIINLAGLHSGLNSVSGDFSLSAHGFEILNGRINRPINQITIAGNLYQMLKDVEAIGDDLSFGFPGNGHFGSPSIKIKAISVAGE